MSVDRTLHHFPLDPASRQVRLAMGEKRLAFAEIQLRYWERPKELTALNPSGFVPVLVETKADRRLVLQWFERKFEFEASGYILHEKMEKRLLGLGAPDITNLRQGRDGLRLHLFYLDKLLQEREWLAGRRLSLADFAGAAHLSVIDYFGDVPWADFPAVKTWYMKLKSRPCFRPLLMDRWPGLTPAPHYDDLDF